MLPQYLRKNGLDVFGVVGEWFSIVMTYSYEMFLDAMLIEIADLLEVSRVSFLRFNAKDGKWILLSSTGVGKMSGVYELQDISLEKPEDGKWIITPTEGIGNDAIFTFEVPFVAEPYFCAIGIDDEESARDFSVWQEELDKIGIFVKEAVMLKLRLFHSESKTVDVRVYEDELTKLPNKRAWGEKVSKLTETETETETHFVMIDLDHFKKINDELGHSIGDRVLQFFAEKLRIVQKGYKDSFFARFGGEEFSGIIYGSENDVDCFFKDLKAELLKDAVISRPLTFSGGTCRYVRGLDVKQCVDVSDYAAYASKECGRNRFMRATRPEMIKEIMGRSKREIIELLKCV